MTDSNHKMALGSGPPSSTESDGIFQLVNWLIDAEPATTTPAGATLGDLDDLENVIDREMAAPVCSIIQTPAAPSRENLPNPRRRLKLPSESKSTPSPVSADDVSSPLLEAIGRPLAHSTPYPSSSSEYPSSYTPSPGTSSPSSSSLQPSSCSSRATPVSSGRKLPVMRRPVKFSARQRAALQQEFRKDRSCGMRRQNALGDILGLQPKHVLAFFRRERGLAKRSAEGHQPWSPLTPASRSTKSTLPPWMTRDLHPGLNPGIPAQYTPPPLQLGATPASSKPSAQETPVQSQPPFRQSQAVSVLTRPSSLGTSGVPSVPQPPAEQNHPHPVHYQPDPESTPVSALPAWFQHPSVPFQASSVNIPGVPQVQQPPSLHVTNAPSIYQPHAAELATSGLPCIDQPPRRQACINPTIYQPRPVRPFTAFDVAGLPLYHQPPSFQDTANSAGVIAHAPHLHPFLLTSGQPVQRQPPILPLDQLFMSGAAPSWPITWYGIYNVPDTRTPLPQGGSSGSLDHVVSRTATPQTGLTTMASSSCHVTSTWNCIPCIPSV